MSTTTHECSACFAPVEPGESRCPRCGAPPGPNAEAAEPDISRLEIVTVACWNLPGSHELFARRPGLAEQLSGERPMERAEACFVRAGAVLLTAEDDPDTRYAIFGARQPSPEDATSAVRAAVAARAAVRAASLELRELCGESVELRVGIDTTKALLGDAAPSAPVSVAGVPLEVAARLAGAAEPGEIVLEEATRRSLGGAFPLGRGRPIEAREIEQDALITAYALGSTAPPRAKPELDLWRRLPRAVRDARRAEIDAARAYLAGVVKGGGARRILLRGPAGSGKAEIVRSLTAGLAGAFGDLAIARAVTPAADEVRVPFGILNRLARSLGRVDTAADRRQARLRFAEEVGAFYQRAGLLLEASEEAWLLHLAGLSELPALASGDPRHASAVCFRSFVDLLRTALTATPGGHPSPLLVIVEEVAAGGERTVQVLARLLGELADLPLMLLITSSDPLERHPDWRPDAERDRVLTVGQLRPPAARLVIDELLGRRAALSPEAADAVVSHAGAGVLAIAETLGALVEGGVLRPEPTTGTWSLRDDRLPSGLPETFEGLVAARIDQLPDAEASLLRRAAVVGRVFWLGFVESLDLPDAATLLGRLEQRGYVRRSYEHTLEGHRGFSFEHEAVRRVAARDVPAEEARELHVRVARWLAVNTGDRFRDWQGNIAVHLDRAGLPESAVPHHLEAGRWARAQGDLALATRHLERARELSSSAGARTEATFELGEALALRGLVPEALAAVEEVQRHADAHGDVRLGLGCAVLLARLHNARAERDAAARAAEAGLPVAASLGLNTEQAELLLELTRVDLARGREEEAAVHAAGAVASFAEIDDRVGRARAGAELGRALLHAGQLERAHEAFEETVADAETLHQWVLASRARHGLAWIALSRGESAAAGESFRVCREVFGRLDARFHHASATLGLALTEQESGRAADAANLAAAGLATARALGHRALEGLARALLGYIFARVELAGERLPSSALSPDALTCARLGRLPHFAQAEALLEGREGAPRLFRLLAALFEAEYRLAKDPAAPEAARALARATTHGDSFEPCVWTERLGALTSEVRARS